MLSANGAKAALTELIANAASFCSSSALPSPSAPMGMLLVFSLRDVLEGFIYIYLSFLSLFEPRLFNTEFVRRVYSSSRGVQFERTRSLFFGL